MDNDIYSLSREIMSFFSCFVFEYEEHVLFQEIIVTKWKEMLSIDF